MDLVQFLLTLIFLILYKRCFGDEEVATLANDENLKYRLHYHIMAPSGWMNDPNGFSFFNGDYHVFYQYNPFDVSPGNIHWGHVKSKDLVHWNYLPNALSPGEPYDKNGCFSGTAIEEENNLLLFYTGNVDDDNSTYYASQSQNMALSVDGVNFEKFSGNPIIPFPPEGGGSAFRDPKVWKHKDNWYLLMGNQAKDDGRVVLYKSEDLDNWDYVGVLASSSNGSLGYMWECPDFFELNGSHVLIFSPQGLERDGDKYANLYQTGYLVGNYCYKRNHFNYGQFIENDFGHDFYAMQTMEAPDKRRIGIAWMGMWTSNFLENEEGWAGALTIPRELYLVEGKLIQKPLQEMQLLRQKPLYSETIAVNGVQELCEVKAAEININSKLCTDNDEFGFMLDDQEGMVVQFYVNQTDKTFNLDRGDDDPRRTGFEEVFYLKMQIFLDASSIEVFLNDGESTFTSRIYPNQSPLLSIYSKGNCACDVDVNIFELENIWKK